jgi:hypothetical protein
MLEIEGTMEERLAIIGNVVKGLHSDVYGNGREGMRDILLRSIAEQNTRAEEVKTALAKRATSQNLWLGILTLILGIIMAYIGIKEYQAHGHASIPALSDDATRTATNTAHLP